jgi:acetylornithine/succinyldiaminopimelate/putrescine aminotransferase
MLMTEQGKQYLDFLSAYSAVNQGHCHPKIVGALIDQAQRLTLSSRAFYNDVFPMFSKFVTEVGSTPKRFRHRNLTHPSTLVTTWSSQ